MSKPSLAKRILDEPTIFLFRKKWQFAVGIRKYVVLDIVLSVLANAAFLLSPLVLAMLLNEIQANGVSGENIMKVLFITSGFFGTSLLFWLFHGPSRIIEGINAFKIDRKYREYMYEGVMNLPLGWHVDRDSGDTIDKVNKATEGLAWFARSFFSVPRIVFSVVGTSIVLMFFMPLVGVIAFCMMMVTFWIILTFDVRLVPMHKELNSYENKISAQVFDGISNVTTVKILHIEQQIQKGIVKSLWNPYSLHVKKVRLVEAKWFSGAMLFSLVIVLPLGFYFFQTMKLGTVLEVGTLSALYIYLDRLRGAYFTFAGYYESLIINKTKVQNAEDIEIDFEKILGARREKVVGWNHLQLKDVQFTYDAEGDVQHVDGVDFEIKEGERIALIGESGSGKTTFLKILHGLYSEAHANLTVDETDIGRIDFSEIDMKTTLVPQEPEIFSSSIRENVTLGAYFTKAHIERALQLSEFFKVISTLPNGLDSVVNEKGVNLSGGQKQRLALARALLFAKDKEMILLDESTSSVDSVNEVKIYKNIFKEFEGRTVLATIHKMNLLKFFDRIVIFDNGKIVDEGTFESLLKTNKKFKKDWEDFVKQHHEE